MKRKIFNKFEKLKPIFENFQKSIEIVIDKTPESLKELSRYGWYIDIDFEPKTPIELFDRIKNGEIDSVDKYLSKYYFEKLNKIESELFETYPNRQSIFKESFDCFREEKYFSAISLLLTQVDGICYEKTQKMFFLNNKKLKKEKIYTPEVEEEIKALFLNGSIMDILLVPIKKATAINDIFENISNYPVKLNRHLILHGIDTEYGSKTNFLKIVSFIKYLNDILKK